MNTEALNHCQDDDPPVECQAVIPLSPNDPAYGKYNMTILKFMRAVTSSNYSCPLVPATVVSFNGFLYILIIRLNKFKTLSAENLMILR